MPRHFSLLALSLALAFGAAHAHGLEAHAAATEAADAKEPKRSLREHYTKYEYSIDRKSVV